MPIVNALTCVCAWGGARESRKHGHRCYADAFTDWLRHPGLHVARLRRVVDMVS